MPAPLNQTQQSLGQQVANTFNTLSRFPGGRFIFNRIIANKIPYSATIGARVMVLELGYAKAQLKDRRKIRNHLNSIHAVALTNFGELTSGLALITSLPANVRGIVTQITTDYVKKARGTLLAECRCNLPKVTSDMDFSVTAVIRDQAQDTVATVTVLWRLGLK